MLRKGRLHFALRGEQLKGEWHLVRMSGSPREKRANWLLNKRPDAAERRGDPDRFLKRRDRSVKTGRSLGEIASDKRSKQWSSKKAANGAQPPKSKPEGKAGPLPLFVPPQLATRVKQPPNGE